VTAITLLGFWGPEEFFDVAIAAFFDTGPVGASSHVYMSGCSMTVHTLHTFIDVIAVCEVDDFLFNLIAQVEHLWVTVQTTLRC
jgi:hypothetical protein